MAPELALAAMQGLAPGARILDPMSGSGTVLRHASLSGHRSVGFDLDPLAVLVSRVSSRKVHIGKVAALGNDVLERVARRRLNDVVLPWLDNCEETSRFVCYWFGTKQRNALRKLAYALREVEEDAGRGAKQHVDVLRIALSRIIITKENGASLARDISHSRPHKVQDVSDYDVIAGFKTSLSQVIRFLEDELPLEDSDVRLGDARNLSLDAKSIDLVVTSPPYLNAIDYLRGHKLSLVWFGYTIEQIRRIRAGSIGAERGPQELGTPLRTQIESAMVDGTRLTKRDRGMVSRYADDLLRMVGEIRRVLKTGGKAVMIVGDCCVDSVFVSNSEGVKEAAKINGLRFVSQASRDLPSNKRYLPITSGSALSRRLRTENVLTFCSA
jgi:DNA modification methylase